MKTFFIFFFIFSGMVLWSVIILSALYLLYNEIRYRIKMHKLYKEAFQELDKQEKEIMDKIKEK